MANGAQPVEGPLCATYAWCVTVNVAQRIATDLTK